MAKFDFNFVCMLVGKLQAREYKANEVILAVNSEDSLCIVLLEGSLVKLKGQRAVERYRRHSFINEEVIY